jgi:hypothetical protein
MIPALLVALQASPIPVAVLAEPGDEIRFEAAILLPPSLDPEDDAMVPALAAAMARATDDYQPGTIAAMTDGRTVKVEALPDCLRVSFGVNANAESSGLDLLASILRRPLLREGGRARPQTGFYAPVLREATALGPVPAEELRLLYEQVVRPERIRVCLAGPVSPDVATKMGSRLTGWPAASRPNSYRKRPTLEKTHPAAGALVLRSPPAPFNATDLGARTVVWAALGSGKGSSLFRVARERLGMSYRQESLLVPGPDGFVPTLLIGTDKPDAESLRKALLEDIEGWAEADIARARGILRANAEIGLPVNPLGGRPADERS